MRSAWSLFNSLKKEPITLQSVNTWLAATQSIQNEKKASHLLAKKLRSVHAATTLRERVQRLEDLVWTCNQSVKKCKDNALRGEINLLKSQAIAFLKAIFDVKTDEELVVKLSENKAKQSKIMLSVQNFDQPASEKNLLSLDERCKNEEKKHHVKYLRGEDRENHRIILHAGKFMQITHAKRMFGDEKELQEDDKTLYLKPFTTLLNLVSAKENSVAMIAVDKYGNMYAGVTAEDFHHSSLLAGEKAFFAGLIKTDFEGKLRLITNESGHYKTKKINLENFLKQLGKHGALADDVKIKVIEHQSHKPLPGIHRVDHSNKVSLPRNYIDGIQYHARKSIYPKSKLPSLKQWKKKSDAGFFVRRSKNLKQVDIDLKQYCEIYNIQSPKENKKLLKHMKHYINLENKTSSDSKHKSVVDEFASQLEQELFFWSKRKNHIKKKASEEKNCLEMNTCYLTS